jgi:hypothetical protein
MNEDHLDLILELVTSPHWKALKREIQSLEAGLTARLLVPSTSLIELVAKEGLSSRLAALRQFVAEIEEKADRHARQVRAERGA